jgi:hypothetical protein
MGPRNPLKFERPIYFGPGVVIWRGLRLLTDVSKLAHLSNAIIAIGAAIYVIDY